MYSMIALVMICLGCFQFIPDDKQKPWYFFIIKALNGGFQSCAWSVNFAIMCNWFPKKGRGLVIGIYGTCTSIGDIIGIQIYTACTSSNKNNWGYNFIILGVIVFGFAILNYFAVIEYPQSVGVTIKEHANIFQPDKVDESTLPVDVLQDEIAPQTQEVQDLMLDQNQGRPQADSIISQDIEDNEEVKSMSFKDALMLRNVIPYAVSLGFCKLAFYGVYYWLPTYLREELLYSKDQAAQISSLSSLGGILGSIILSVCSDLFMFRGPFHFLGCIVGGLSLSFFITVHDQSQTGLLTFLTTSFIFFVQGATVVISLILVDISKTQIRRNKGKSLSTISGIVDGVGGMGSIIGQLLIGPVQDWKGWSAGFAMFALSSYLASIPSIRFTYEEYQQFKAKKSIRQQKD